MERRSIARNGNISVVCCAAVVSASLTPLAFGQQAFDLSAAGAVSNVDAYGNARPAQRERMRIGRFSNPTQRRALRGFQSEGRRRNQRGGLVPYSFAGDSRARGFAGRLNAGRGAMGARLGMTSPGLGLPRTQQTVGRDRAGDIGSAFARRYTLIRGSSINAPVYRALQQRRGPPVLSSSMAQMAHVSGESPPSTTDAAGLGDQLRSAINRSYLRTRAEAWILFRSGQYRRAARAFEAATTLQPSDMESRIGALFSYLSVQAMRTSLALLGEIARRDSNPFSHDLNVSERFGSTMESRRLQIGTRLFVESGRGSDAASALQAFVLWYLDKRPSALAAAEPLKSARRGSVFVAWHAKMASELAAATGSPVPDPHRR